MSECPSAADWRSARGDKWRLQCSGMEAMLSPTDEPLMRALQLTGPCRIADLGCGGGGTTLEIARRAPTGSQVDGYDISAALIELARSRVEPGARHLRFAVADLATAAPDAPYDRLVSRFGVMFFDQPQEAFANLRHWLAPGGRCAFAVWGPPTDNAWFAITREVVARCVDMPRPEPDAPGPFRYQDAGILTTLLERVGFDQLAVTDWRGHFPIGGMLPPAAAADFALAAVSSFGELLAQAGEAALTTARRLLTERFSEHFHDGAVSVPARIHLITGGRR